MDIALDKSRPKSFELMISLLEPLDSFCLSKMMLKSFPSMIKMGTGSILKFLDTCTYKPLVISNEVIVRWPNEMKELVFSSSTSLID